MNVRKRPGDGDEEGTRAVVAGGSVVIYNPEAPYGEWIAADRENGALDLEPAGRDGGST